LRSSKIGPVKKYAIMALIAGKKVFIGVFLSAIVAYLYVKRWPPMQSGYEYIGRKSLILKVRDF